MVNADVQINPPNFVGENPNWVSILACRAICRTSVARSSTTSRRSARVTTAPPQPSGVGFLEDAVAAA